MKRWFGIAGALALIITLWVGAFLVVNHNVSGSPRDIERMARADLPKAGDTLDLLIWNLGYGGLGEGSDFVADGGTHTFPPSRAAVRANVDGIERFLHEQSADVVMLEEIAHGGPVNYWVDLKARIDTAFLNRDRIYYPDFKTRLMPWPLAMNHGQALYSRRFIESTDLVALPVENEGIGGVRRRYASTVARLPIEGRGDGWTLCVVHLAAFDANATIRTQQLREVLAWAEREYQSGRHVVLGGDWNLKLAETNFPNTTEERFLFWVFPFPQDALPQGWRIGADASTPSVRTNERPFHRGENYTTVIDGFIVSPNVEIEHVEGVDLGFVHSDHNPVRARVRAR